MAKVIYDQAAYERGTQARIIANARATWRRVYGDVAQRILDDAFQRMPLEKDTTPTFLDNLAVALDTYGKLSEKQTLAYVAALNRIDAKKAERQAAFEAKKAKLAYIGTNGKRETLTLTVKKITHYQGTSFSYYDSGYRTVTIMEDADGNVAIYTGGNALGEEGQTITVTARLRHGEYKGAKQTVLSRPHVKG